MKGKIYPNGYSKNLVNLKNEVFLREKLTVSLIN